MQPLFLLNDISKDMKEGGRELIESRGLKSNKPTKYPSSIERFVVIESVSAKTMNRIIDNKAPVYPGTRGLTGDAWHNTGIHRSFFPLIFLLLGALYLTQTLTSRKNKSINPKKNSMVFL